MRKQQREITNHQQEISKDGQKIKITVLTTSKKFH